MKSVASGVSGASPIWRNAILAALDKKPVVEFKMPSGIESIALDKVSGYPAHDDFETKEALIIRGSKPTSSDPVHVKLKVCKSQEDKLAPPALVAKNEHFDKEFFIFKESDPIYGDKDNRWQKGIDEWVVSQSDSPYHPPTEYCDGGDEIVVRFESPEDKSQTGNEIEIRTSIGTMGDVDRVEYFANDKKIGESKDKPYRVKTRLDDGVYSLKAKVFRKDGKTGEQTIKIGVNKPHDWAAPTPSPTPSPTPTVSATPSPTPSPSPLSQSDHRLNEL